jgi:hypothetical protein
VLAEGHAIAAVRDKLAMDGMRTTDEMAVSKSTLRSDPAGSRGAEIEEQIDQLLAVGWVRTCASRCLSWPGWAPG